MLPCITYSDIIFSKVQIQEYYIEKKNPKYPHTPPPRELQIWHGITKVGKWDSIGITEKKLGFRKKVAKSRFGILLGFYTKSYGILLEIQK